MDATFKAIESVAKSGAELLLFSVNAVTQGTESQGEVTVRLSKGGRIVNGVGADTDIVVASAKAYISALNKLASKIERVNPQYQLVRGAALALLLPRAAPAHAQMYKCVDARGVTQYSDKPCPDGKGREVDIQGHAAGIGQGHAHTAKTSKRRRERSGKPIRSSARHARRSELDRASATRRPANADAHDARIARLQAEVAKICR